MHKKIQMNWTKIKGGCQWGRKVVTHNSKSDLPLRETKAHCADTTRRNRIVAAANAQKTIAKSEHGKPIKEPYEGC